MNLKKLLIVSLSALALIACGNGGITDSKDATGKTEKSQVNETKNPSGSFTLYTSQPEKDIAQLAEGFNNIYPDIKVDVFRSGTEEVISKVQAEKEAGNILADVLLVSDSFTFEGLSDQNLLQSYKSPELKGIPEIYVDDDNLYTGTKIIATGIAVNTDMIDPSTVTGFSDLIKKDFENLVMIPSPLYSGSASLNLSIIKQQKELGFEWYEKLHENSVFVGEGNGTVQTALLNGQEGVGMLVDFMAIRSKADGAPIEFIYPKEGTPYVTEPIGILNDADNPELAKLFVDYVLSEKGQELTSKIGYTPVKENVQAPEGMLSVDEITPITFDETKVIEKREADKEQFAELFGAAK